MEKSQRWERVKGVSPEKYFGESFDLNDGFIIALQKYVVWL